eukprot:TRINITY_DN363_c0_g1_i1.p1 TRINITY_DN363_c0_g1~~TRINITY_DN363_c0_g1_i1.p1  ORF type:complete len:225 (+),score=110.55 TRINITY_DN363_c0_g1_i1:134-808(+)
MAPKKSNAKPAAKKAVAKAAPKAAEKPKASGGADNGVYVKGLNFPGISHDTIKQAFKQQGDVKDVVLRRRKYTILYFKDGSGASKVREMNGKVVKGSKITVEAAKKKQKADRATYCKSVFVGNLPRMPHAQGKVHLKKEFSKCGQVVKVRTYQSGHGFVYFADNAAAKKAVTSMDHQSLGKPFPESRQVTVQYSIRSKDRDAKKEAVRKQRIAAKKALKKAKKN